MANQKEIKNLNDGLTQMIELVGKLEKQFISADAAMVKGMDAVVTAAKKGIEAEEGLTGAKKEHREQITLEQKQAQELIKAKDGLNAAATSQAKLTLLLKKQKQDLIKQQKLELTQGKGQVKTYEQLSARYRLAAKNAKNLAVEFGTNSDQAREAIAQTKEYNDQLKEVDESLGNSQRNVGNYSSALEDMEGALAGAGGGIGVLVTGFKEFFKNPYVAAFAAIGGAVAGIVSVMRSSRSGTAVLDKGMLELSSRATVLKSKIREGTEEMTEQGGAMKGLNKIMIALNGGHDIAQSMAGKTSDVYKEQIDIVKKLSKELVDLNNAYIDIENELLVQVATQQGLAEEQMIIADDATRSIQERRAAAQEAYILEEQASKASVKLAEERLGIAEAEMEIYIEAGELRREADGSITSLSIEAIELEKNYTSASIAAIEASNNLTNARLNNQKRLSEINQDDFEQELDFLLDIADVQKTVNEQMVADTKRSYGERQSILDETNKLLDTSYNEQITLFKEQLGVELDRNKLASLNNKEIFEYARGLEMSEIATNRLREVIMERRKAVQDLTTAQRDLNSEQFGGYDSQLDADVASVESEIDAELAADEKALEDSLKKQEDLRIAAGKEEIANYKEQQAQKKEAAKQAGQLLLDTLTMFAEQRIAQAELEVEAADTRVDAAENNLTRQMSLFDQGYAADVAGAQKALDLEKQTQDRALAEKKKALEQKQKLETIEQGISIVTSVANIIQGFSSIPVVGWALGIAAGAAMIAAYASQKSQAKAAAQSYGEGGVIDLEGGSHASGNDISFGYKGGKELKAEGGEKGAIFSRKAVKHYGSGIDRLVHATNRMQLEEQYTKAFDLGAMPVYVENNSNFDSQETRRTNTLLKQLVNKTGDSDTQVGHKRIIKKNNITRIING